MGIDAPAVRRPRSGGPSRLHHGVLGAALGRQERTRGRREAVDGRRVGRGAGRGREVARRLHAAARRRDELQPRRRRTADRRLQGRPGRDRLLRTKTDLLPGAGLRARPTIVGTPSQVGRQTFYAIVNLT